MIIGKIDVLGEIIAFNQSVTNKKYVGGIIDVCTSSDFSCKKGNVP